jgi:hypothetical protein
MKMIILAAGCILTALNSFADQTSTCKCEQAEYAELKTMTKNELFKVYCVAKVGYDFDRKVYEESGSKQSLKDMKACLEEMQRAEDAYKEKFGNYPPSCEKLKKTRIKIKK